MRHNKKVIGLIIIMLIISTICSLTMASAEEVFNFNSAETQALCASLTESDDLDGMDITVDEYIETLRGAGYSSTTAGLLEHGSIIQKIIPIGVLYNKGEYFYSGKEYAFYVEKYDNYNLTIFLIDYDYLFYEPKNTISINIDVISIRAESDYRENSNELMFYGEENQKYLLYNPQIYGYIQNLHAINHFDSSYTKATDPGAIVDNVALSYEGEFQITSYDPLGVAQYGISVLFGEVFSSIPGVNVAVGLYNFIDAVAQGYVIEDCRTSVQTDKFTVTNEKKSYQISDIERHKLTKTFNINTFGGNLKINKKVYLEVELTDEDVPTQIDIGAALRIYDLDLNNYINEAFYISFIDELYEQVYQYNYSETNNVYVLEESNQIYSVYPYITGNYQISTNSGCTVNVYRNYNQTTDTLSTPIQKTGNTYQLNANMTYYIEFTNPYSESNNYPSRSGTFSVDLVVPDLAVGANTISSTYTVFEIDDTDEYEYTLETNDSAAMISVYTDMMSLVAREVQDVYFGYKETDKQYVVIEMFDTPQGTVTLTFTKNIDFYNIEYIIPNEVDIDTISFTPIDTYTGETEVILPTVTSAQHVFCGWYTDANYTTQVTSIPAGTTGNKMFYAKFEIRYNVIFDSNGGSYCAPMTVSPGTVITLPTSIREGYMGTWLTWGYDGFGYIGDFGTSYTVSNDITLTAQWEQYFQITFENLTINGHTATVVVSGTTTPAPTIYFLSERYYFDMVEPVFPTGVNTSLTFGGWFWDSEYTSEAFWTGGMSEDITVYAYWATSSAYSLRSVNSIMNEDTLNAVYNTYLRLNKTGAELNEIGIHNITITIRVYLSEDTQAETLSICDTNGLTIDSETISGTAGEYVDVTFNVLTSELNTVNKIDVTYSGVLIRPMNITVSYS